MERNNKKLIIISVISIIALVGLIIKSYAYFSSKSEQTQTVQADQVDIHFSDESAEIKLEKVKLINSDELFDKAAKKEFAITNNGASAAKISLIISDIEFDDNKKLATDDLKWELYQEDNLISNGDFSNLDNNYIIMKNILIDLKSTTDKYTLYLYLLNSTTKDQNYLQGGTFKAKITISSMLKEKKKYNIKLLSGKIISNNANILGTANEDKPDFDKTATTDEGMFLDRDNDGYTYYFRGAVTDNYVAIDGIKGYGNDSVCTGGKSMNKPTRLGSYSSAVSSCNNGFYSYAGYETPDACVADLDCLVYTVGTSTNKVSKIGTYADAYNTCNNSYSNYGYSSSNECLADLVSEDSYAKNKLWRIIRINGDGTIRLIANSPVGNSKFNNSYDSEEYVGYTYKTRTGYKMGERANSEGTKSINSSTGYYYADEFTFDSTNGGYTLTNPVLHTGEECNNNKSLCEGKYTQFSERTSKNDYLYQITTVESTTSIKYYAYQRKGKVTSDENSADNDSTIKAYLNNWYKTNLANEEDTIKNFDNLIANTRYCNDTTSQIDPNSGIQHYGAYDRLYTNKTPTFICPNTDKSYGGEYDLKVGLLSVDKALYAGGTDSNNTKYYLNRGTYYWLGSPYFFSGSAHEFYLDFSKAFYYYSLYNNYAVVPVINLKSNIFWSDGNGSQTNPYTVSVN